MKREPFTRNVAPGPKPAWCSAAMSASTSVKCSRVRAPIRLADVGAGVAQRVQRVDAAFRRISAHFAMKRRALVADFAHVAHHEHARRRLRREHVDGGAHRIGVRVVRIVDDGCAFERLQRGALHLQAALHRLERFEAALDRIERHARRERRRRRGQRVARVVFAEHLQRDVDSGPSGVSISTLVAGERAGHRGFDMRSSVFSAKSMIGLPVAATRQMLA